VLEQLKNYPEAKRQLEKAVALGTDEPNAHYELFKVLRAMGAAEEAQAELKRFQEAKRNQADRTQAASKAELGDQALASGDTQKAVSLYREAVEMNPREPLLAYKLAMAFDHASDFTSEREALEKAIRVDPDMALAQNQLGYLDYRAGEYATAQEHFQWAVKASPRFLKAWMNLAASLALESQWQEAKGALRHVLELDPGNAQAAELNQRIDEMQASR
jgi:tetratricopeptide (TPR) repeat protein